MKRISSNLSGLARDRSGLLITGAALTIGGLLLLAHPVVWRYVTAVLLAYELIRWLLASRNKERRRDED